MSNIRGRAPVASCATARLLCMRPYRSGCLCDGLLFPAQDYECLCALRNPSEGFSILGQSVKHLRWRFISPFRPVWTVCKMAGSVKRTASGEAQSHSTKEGERCSQWRNRLGTAEEAVFHAVSLPAITLDETRIASKLC